MSIESLDPAAAHAAMSGGDDHVFVDVRTVEEYEQGHPIGAVNVPWALRDPNGGGMAPNPDFVPTMQKHFGTDTKLYLSCQAGMRSMNACKDLAGAGYTRLVNVDGGFGGRRDPTGTVVVTGWKDSGLPVETSSSGYAGMKG